MLFRKITSFSLLVLWLCSCQSTSRDASSQEGDEAGMSLNKTNTSPAGADTSTVSRNAVEQDWLLSPGVGAGQTRLGQSSESAMQRLGPPDDGDAATMHTVQVWYADHQTKSGHSLAIYTVRDPGNDPAARITELRVNSPRFQTERGIGVGSSLAKIQSDFQLEKGRRYHDKGPAYTLYDDSAAGVAFEIDASDTCRAIVIHRVGKPFAGSYLSFP